MSMAVVRDIATTNSIRNEKLAIKKRILHCKILFDIGGKGVKKQGVIIIGIAIACCVIMGVVDAVIQPQYWIKSACKALLFLIMPAVFAICNRNVDIKSLFKPNKRGMKLAFCLCVPLYVLILGAYLLLKNVFDFSQVTGALTGNIGVDKNNFVFVAIYISFVNSLLEEFFFRGFSFLTLKKYASKKLAYIFSALVFALYHIAMMTGWFGIWVFALALLGLFAGGLIFNYLDEKSDNIYTSWFVHMFANFAINTIGFMLFGII